MNRLISSFTTGAVLCWGSALFAFAHAQTAAEGQNLPSGEVRANITAGSAQPTRGVVFFTAVINSDGTVAGCFGCNTANTQRLVTGWYQIDFGQNVQAINGWSRWVQPDTLTFGTEKLPTAPVTVTQFG